MYTCNVLEPLWNYFMVSIKTMSNIIGYTRADDSGEKVALNGNYSLSGGM